MTTTTAPLLLVDSISKRYPRRRATLFSRAPEDAVVMSDVSFRLERGSVLGIVGGSGSGKTTIARVIVGLIAPTSGTVRFKGTDIFALPDADLRRIVRPAIRMIFQDPDAPFNQHYRVRRSLERAIELHRGDGTETPSDIIARILPELGMPVELADKYPDQLSGGQKRRLGICRALLTDPEIIVADEPLSGLDVILQERVLGLLRDEQITRKFALVLVSHDLDRVNQVCDRVIVMYAGRMVESIPLRRGSGERGEAFAHPYSVALHEAQMVSGASRALPMSLPVIPDDTLDPHAATRGCSYAKLCSRRASLSNPPICDAAVPALQQVADDHAVACHFAGESQPVTGRFFAIGEQRSHSLRS